MTHHIRPITPDNIIDVNVTLAEDNLIYLCRDCHAAAHTNRVAMRNGLKFDETGEFVEISAGSPLFYEKFRPRKFTGRALSCNT